MASNPKDDNRRTISFCNDAKQRILVSTKLPLHIAAPQEPRFWTEVENACRIFAGAAKLEMQHRPSIEDVNKAHNTAKRLRAEVHSIYIEQPGEPTDFEQVFLAVLEIFIKRTHPDYEQSRLDALFKDRNTIKQKVKRPLRNSKPAPTKPKLWAGRELIHTMGRIYRRAFDRSPAATEDGPFTRFVLACLAETTGLPYKVTPDWVRKYVLEHRDIAKQRGHNPWSLDEHQPWDDPS